MNSPNEVIQLPTQKIGQSLKAINETSEISLVLHLLPIYWIKIQDEGVGKGERLRGK